MKKVFVIAITMILGLGLAAFAGPLTGSWATTLVVDPAASTFTSLTSTLAVDYTVSGWTFGSSSGFTLSGFSSQSFTAGGSVGAFTFSSTMAFDPMAVTGKDYSAFWAAVLLAYPSGLTQTPSVTICPITYTTTTEPKFLTWKTEGSISIGGVEIGALFYIDQSNYDVTLTNYATNLALTSLSSTTYVCTSGYNGAGWRFKVGGTIGDITATSYTYFNLSETDASTTYCPAVGKSGTLSIAATSCAPAFSEEYITLEGVSLGCATFDVGLSILCTGFSDVTFVANDVAIGSWLELDFGLVFTTTSKSTDFCLTVTAPASDCFTIEFGFNGSPNPDATGVIESLDFYGIGFTYNWNGISFTSYTELSPYSALFSSSSAYDYIYNDTTNSYLIPYAGRKVACSTVADVAINYWRVTGESVYYELQCVYTDRYKLWEKFIIDIDADACCGGALDLTISTWFGDHETLSWVYYDYVVASGTAVATGTYLFGGPTGATVTLIADVDTEVYDQVFFSTGYVAGTETTLFDWAKTEVDASIGVASNITLDLGFNVSAFGWESLEVGFTFIF